MESVVLLFVVFFLVCLSL